MLTILMALCAAAPLAAADGPNFAIRARTVWAGQGRVLENATVLVVGGRIQSVGTKVDVPGDVEVIEHDGVLTAGMIALHGASGAVGETRDGTRPALPEARVGLAIDHRHPDFEALRAAGITSVVVSPDPAGISGGTTAVVATSGGIVRRDPAHLSLVMSGEGLASNREPTSHSGARALLDRLFKDGRGVVEDARSGRLPCLFEVRERDDVLRAVAFAREKKLKGFLHGAWLAGELAEPIQSAGLMVAVPSLTVGTPQRVLDGVVALAKAGVPFGYGLDAPWSHPAALRFSAALCVRAGLDKQTAWDALTATAARIAGVDATTGRIDRGLDADLVLWSGDPLDLSSRPTAVIIRGREVHTARADTTLEARR